MRIEETFLFNGITAEDTARIISCFDIRCADFEAGDTVCSFDECRGMIGIVMSGNVSLVRHDSNGKSVVLESLFEDDVFGEAIAFSSSDAVGVRAVCVKKSRVAFFGCENIAKRCEKACRCHAAAVENMFRTVTSKTRRISERAEILANRSIRDKLMCLFEIYSAREGKAVFELPFSLSYLAEYICVDRSAMMREIKKMSDQGLIRTERRRIELLH